MLVYSLEGQRLNDSWYCKDGEWYHSFFLQTERRGLPQRCGHMVSKDLINWEYKGVVLEPEDDKWDNFSIATGSVAKYDGKWYMLYTGISKETDIGEKLGGIGLAVSDDLYNWEKVGDGPVIKRCWQETEYGIGYPMEYDGETVTCYPLADPYIYPEPINGEFYIFINSYAADFYINQRGGTAIFKTKDFKTFTPYKFAVVDICDRMETVDVWEHDGRWYMYSGCAAYRISGEDVTKLGAQINTNRLFVADDITGPYHRIQKLDLPVNPDCPGQPYILKVLKDPSGKEVMLMNNIPHGVEGPFNICYNEDGTVEFKS